MPLFYYCVGIVLFILFTSNIRSKLLARQPLLPPLSPMPHPEFETPPKTSTSTASDSTTSSLINANKITICSQSAPPSSGISASSFPLSNDKCRACLNVNCLSNQLLIPFSHSANKITASFEIDSLIGLLTNYALINSYLFFGFHFFFSLLILSLSLYCLPSFLIIDAQAAKHFNQNLYQICPTDSLIYDNSTGSVKAVDVAAPAGNLICTDCSHLYPLKGKFCEPSAD